MNDDSSASTSWIEWKLWSVLKGLFSFSSLIIASVGLYFVVLELRQNEQLRREDLRHRKADASLSFVERFNSQTYIEARNELIRPWLQYQAQLGLANKHGGISNGQMKYLLSFILQRNREGSGTLDTQILTIVTFFDELAICIDANICDCDVALLYFQSRAQSIKSLYGFALDEMSEVFDLNYAGSGLNMISEIETCEKSGY